MRHYAECVVVTMRHYAECVVVTMRHYAERVVVIIRHYAESAMQLDLEVLSKYDWSYAIMRIEN